MYIPICPLTLSIQKKRPLTITFLLTLLFLLAPSPGMVTYAVDGSVTETVEVEEIVITASRYKEIVSTVPANVTVISEEDIKNSTAQNIPDLLRTEAGIQVNDIAGNRRNITVDVRGFGETASMNTLVLVDGRRVNQADLSGVDWTQIPIDRVERIEIIRGGTGSVLYGDNASGGVINIITKEGRLFRIGMGLTVGSYGTFKSSADVSGSNEDLSYSLSVSYLNSDGYRVNSGTEAKDIGMNLGYNLNSSIRINLSSGYHMDETGLPGALKDSDLAAGISRTDSINPDDFAEVEDYYIKGGPEIYFGEENVFKAELSYRKRNFLSFASFTGGSFLADTDIETVGVSPQVLFKNRIGRLKNSLTIGVDYQDAEEDILNESLFFGSQTTGKYRLKKENYGYYIHDEITAGGISLSAGYRHDRADFKFDPGTPDRAKMDEDLYTAGVNYSLGRGSYAYMSFSKSFRYPVLDELFSFFTNTVDTGLTPQRSDDYEAGIRYYFTEDLHGHINIFRVDTDDEIFFNPSTYMNENLDGVTRREGIEVSVSARAAEWLTLNGSFTYMDTLIDGGSFNGNKIPNVPSHKATIGVIFSAGRGLTIALNGIYVGERPFISDFSNEYGEQEGYAVFNGKVKYQWKNLTAFLDVNNITNKKYAEYGVLGGYPLERAYYPSPERNFLAGLSVEF